MNFRLHRLKWPEGYRETQYYTRRTENKETWLNAAPTFKTLPRNKTKHTSVRLTDVVTVQKRSSQVGVNTSGNLTGLSRRGRGWEWWAGVHARQLWTEIWKSLTKSFGKPKWQTTELKVLAILLLHRNLFHYYMYITVYLHFANSLQMSLWPAFLKLEWSDSFFDNFVRSPAGSFIYLINYYVHYIYLFIQWLFCQIGIMVFGKNIRDEIV